MAKTASDDDTISALAKVQALERARRSRVKGERKVEQPPRMEIIHTGYQFDLIPEVIEKLAEYDAQAETVWDPYCAHMFYRSNTQSDMRSWFMKNDGKELVGYFRKLYVRPGRDVIVAQIDVQGHPNYLVIKNETRETPFGVKKWATNGGGGLETIEIDRIDVPCRAYVTEQPVRRNRWW